MIPEASLQSRCSPRRTGAGGSVVQKPAEHRAKKRPPLAGGCTADAGGEGVSAARRSPGLGALGSSSGSAADLRRAPAAPSGWPQFPRR